MAAQSDGPGAALAAARTRLGLVSLLLGLTALAWWSTADRMAGMDGGPNADLGALAWFTGLWVVMMAAMMIPAIAPTVALYARMTRRRAPDHALLFTGAYLVVWGLVGVAAYGLFSAGRGLFGHALAWNAGGRWLAAGVLGLAAVYELTPLKYLCLERCRSPLGFLLGAWRDGRRGAIGMGARHAVWCVGCCWALMAALFALGVMSLVWTAVVAALITLEKTLPWRRPATWGTAALLAALALTVALVPDRLPGFVVPGGHGAMATMSSSR